MRYLLGGLLCACCMNGYGLTVETQIEAVTVYNQGALVTRSGLVTLQQGENALKISGLTSALASGQANVEVVGDGVLLGQVNIDVVQAEDAFNADVQALQEKIDTVQETLSELSDGTATAQLQLRFLEGIAQGYAKESWFEGARGAADISSWRSALAVLDEGSAKARQIIRANNKASAQGKAELSKLTRELQDLRGRRKSSVTVAVSATVKQSQQAMVRITYYQKSANWRPKYVAYLDSNSRDLRLLQEAVVTQTSDEAWHNVEMKLSSSKPSGELMAPEVESEFLDLYDPRQDKVRRRAQSIGLQAAPALMEEIVVTGKRITVEVDNFAVNYSVPGRVSVANAADESQTFELSAMEFNAELVTRVVPRQSDEAFLVAKFNYDKEVPLYGSDMTVYVDQTFVGETWLDTTLPNTDVVLPVGQDRRVSVTVRNLGGLKEESGLIGRRKQELTDLLFELANQRTSNTMVEVFDWYPEAVNEDIEVEVPRDATKPTEVDVGDYSGVVVWRKMLTPGARWQIKHQYEISYPADKVLQRN